MPVMICLAVLFGNFSISPAVNPAMRGAEKDVPFPVVMLLEIDPKTVACPIAETSGLILWSKLGPNELKLAFAPLLSTAPTAKISSASAGEEMYFHTFAPSFPALITQIIPLSVAQLAAKVLSTVLPSRLL